MRRFTNLPPMPATAPSPALADTQAPCGGCGAKVGGDPLRHALERLAQRYPQHCPSQLGNDDAVLISGGDALLQSVDVLRAMVTDPWMMGRIAANHALSDLYAMGARPVAAQVWTNIAFAHPRLQKRDHRLLMSGIAESLQEQQVVLAGGHSTEGMEDHIAIVANGEVGKAELWKKNTPREGDVLILTKPLGTGVILAADMQAQAGSIAIDGALDSMLQSNCESANLLREFNPSAVTDVTGFGLLGHLLEMTDSEDAALGATLSLHQIPLLPGALSLAQQGVRSTLFPQLEPLLHQCEIAADLESSQVNLLLDPQTSGGLLIAIASREANEFITRYSGDAAIIGTIEKSQVSVQIH